MLATLSSSPTSAAALKFALFNCMNSTSFCIFVSDIYYRKAKEEGWRARSAFKLFQIDEEFNSFQGVKRVVDLCAAPGSWSLVLSRKLYLPAKQSPASKDGELPLIVAIDLQPMAPIEGVIQVQGDITNARTAEMVIRHFDGCEADLVCDGAPDVPVFMKWMNLFSPNPYLQWKIYCKNISWKRYKSSVLPAELFFPVVTFAKPKSSRNSSIEAFAACENYSPPEGFNPKDLHRLLDMVGSPSGVDDLDCSSGCPHPIAPPYKRALEMKKASSHGIRDRDLEKPSSDS
ncbi:putative tRNA (cytidine(32)/guanosine(34)-2'-O)-methyltransferase [Hibiscus syriacus]|uniref:tRNA (Cytidine(32)/guanosine(34)-2'-O)-methyltransferase n=1 Tax=Hibiscus syriacus TaxID=106335 RepID=A0A6A2W8Z2_HIBSY|nr:putative tRNA (cytidine(32)/guanosine(34)-2'-O)-methyltransferase [Hibiscus syriacus]